MAFLISNDRRDSAYNFYSQLKDNDTSKRQFNSRFDNWRDGQPDKPHRYHGWNKTEFGGRYTKCFVFKYKQHRLYGFLCNPKDDDNRYQICILVCHAIKKDHETDKSELDYVENKRSDISIHKTIKDYLRRTL
ncbi:MAG: hypothetical protein EPN22_08100 [Nitrospirae bacterium]|nr:MAG: hypothetical protein EPN22_08100 [Nitrospirota bacterium]